MIFVANPSQKGDISISFTDTELKSAVVVAESNF